MSRKVLTLLARCALRDVAMRKETAMPDDSSDDSVSLELEMAKLRTAMSEDLSSMEAELGRLREFIQRWMNRLRRGPLDDSSSIEAEMSRLRGDRALLETFVRRVAALPDGAFHRPSLDTVQKWAQAVIRDLNR